jgi:hypothetical protein
VLLAWGIETTVCDNDIVFLRDVRELFREESNMEVGVEGRGVELGQDFPCCNFNIGFMRVFPGALVMALFKKWIFEAREPTGLNQLVFYRVLKRYRLFGGNGTGWFNLSRDLSGSELFGMRLYDPLFVQNGNLMKDGRDASTRLARIRNIREPYVCHFAAIAPAAKISVFRDWGLWFASNNNSMCGSPPDKRFYAPWRAP